MDLSNYISVSILCAINLLNYMDRFTIAGVLSKIEEYYGLSHAESGLLQTSFVISYMIMAPIFGYLGDRYSRKYIIIFGVLFWSFTTFLGSFVPRSHKIIFFLMRALVGVGEASYSTIAPTIIADLFNRDMRTRMLTIFYFAIPVGSGLGYIVGSSVADALSDWRWALRVTPPLGVVCVGLVFMFLREPQRGHSDGVVETLEKTKLINDLKYFATVRSLIWSTVGFTCVCFAIGALSWWAPTYMKYAYQVKGVDMTDDRIGLIFGIIACVGGIIGVLLGSGGAQYYRKYNPQADPLVCAFGVLGGVPCVFLGISIAQSSFVFSWIFIFIGITLLSMNWAIVADMLLYVITPNRRSLAQSVQILISHLFGDASSPFIVGIIADSLAKDNSAKEKFSSLEYALFITPFVLILGGIAFLYTSTFIVSDHDLCKAQIQGRVRNSSDTSIHTLPPSGQNNVIITQNIDNSHNTLIDSDSNNLLSEQY